MEGAEQNRRVINLVIDVSGSMNEEQKLLKAKKAVQDMVNMLGSRDTLSLMVFSTKFAWVKQSVKMDEKGRKEMTAEIGSRIAQGETVRYDSVLEAYRQLQNGSQADRITAVVVLTDGEDNNSKLGSRVRQNAAFPVLWRVRAPKIQELTKH